MRMRMLHCHRRDPMRHLCLKNTPQISPPTRQGLHLEGIVGEPMKSAGEHPKQVISWKLDPFQAFQFGCPEPLVRILIVFTSSESDRGHWGFFEEFSFK